MKKYSIYIGLVVVGLLMGWFIFGTGSATTEQSHDHESGAVENQMWTCSMHPQIMQPDPGDCPICGMDLIPAEANADGLLADQFKMTENAMALANIETTVITLNSATEGGLLLSGKIQENEKTTSIQTAHFGGRIEKLYINSIGEEIAKGQLLALIYSPELVTAQKELLTALDAKNKQPELYKAVRNKLKLWKLSEQQITQIETDKRIIENFPVYANVSGIVTQKMVDEGNHLMEGNPIFKLVNLNSVWAHFDAYEKQLLSIKTGDELVITTNADPSRKINATISFIDPILNTATRTTIVRAELSNKDGLLKPGMFVQAELITTSNSDTGLLSIPKSAVLWTGKRSVVYIKSPGSEPVFEMREVKLGNEIGDHYEILEGLLEQEEIVTNGTFTVDAAAQLQGKKSMMNQGDEKSMTGHEIEPEIIERIPVSSTFQEQLKSVFKDYILVKDALVNDDQEKAQTLASNISTSLEQVDMKLLTDTDAHHRWMQLLSTLTESSNAIAASDEIETQRNSFMALSNAITTSIELFGINEKVYIQYCPMANNDNGASWLSVEEEILNPYFGDMMLNCGNVEKVIKN